MARNLDLEGKVVDWVVQTFDADELVFDALRVDEAGTLTFVTMRGTTVTLDLDKGDYPYVFKQIKASGSSIAAANVYGAIMKA